MKFHFLKDRSRLIHYSRHARRVKNIAMGLFTSERKQWEGVYYNSIRSEMYPYVLKLQSEGDNKRSRQFQILYPMKKWKNGSF